MTRTKTAAATGVTTALLYSRVSTEEQGDTGVSLAAQVAECQRYARARGWVIGTEFQDIMSGRRNDRPGYVAMIEEMHRLRSEGKGVAVVVADLDRLGRDLLETLRFRKDLKEKGAPLHIVRDGGEVDDLKADLMAVIAKNESERTGRRVKATRADLIDKGWSPPGRPAWGYVWRDSTGEEKQQGAPRRVLDLDPAAAPYVREMFERAARGESTRSIAAWVRTLPSEARSGRVLNASAVRFALYAPVYVSRVSNRKEPPTYQDVLAQPAGRWPRLVSDDDWLTIHRRLATNEAMPAQASGEHLLTGLLRCWKCGQRMGGIVRHENGGRYVKRLYRCHRAMDGCVTVSSVKVLDALMTEHIGALLTPMTLDGPRRQQLDAQWKAQQAPPKNDRSQKRRQHLEGIVSRARQRIDVATDRFLDGGLPKDEYDRAVGRYMKEIEDTEQQLAAMATPKQPAGIVSNLPAVLRMLDDLAVGFTSEDTADRRDVLRELVVKIEPKRLGYGAYRLEIADITWTPLGDALVWLAERSASILQDGVEETADAAPITQEAVA